MYAKADVAEPLSTPLRSRAAHRRSGGGVFEEEWQGPGVVVRNAFDCEGNVFQVRELRD